MSPLRLADAAVTATGPAASKKRLALPGEPDGAAADPEALAAAADASELHSNAELKQRVADLEAANAGLQKFAAGAAHDLRSPLGHIQGFAELLVEGDHLLDATARRHAETILRAARRMNQLIVDLLDLAAIDSAPLRPEPVALDRLLARVRAARDGSAATTGHIEWTIGALPTVSGDAALLRIAFERLVDNAVKFSASRDRPRIDIAVRGTTAYEVVICVRDNGVGYEPRYAERLFQPLQRLHPASRFSGSGVGLAMVQRIAARHCGRVWAKSEPNRGASFFIALPRS